MSIREILFRWNSIWTFLACVANYGFRETCRGLRAGRIRFSEDGTAAYFIRFR
jgi:hypothetical protein